MQVCAGYSNLSAPTSTSSVFDTWKSEVPSCKKFLHVSLIFLQISWKSTEKCPKTCHITDQIKTRYSCWTISQISLEFTALNRQMHQNRGRLWCGRKFNLVNFTCPKWALYVFAFYSHPTSCASMAEIMSVLFFHTMRYKGTNYSTEYYTRHISKLYIELLIFRKIFLLHRATFNIFV